MAAMLLPSLSGPRAVAELLSLHGRASARAWEPEVCTERVSPAELAAALVRQGMPARPVRVRWDELRRLSMPTALLLLDGQVVVATAARARSLTLLGSGGELNIGRARLEGRWSGHALDLSAGFPEQGSFWSRLAAALGGQLRPLVTLASIGAVSYAFGLVLPAVTRLTLDSALPNGARQSLYVIALAVVLLGLHRAWLEWLRQRAIRSVDAQLQAQLLQSLCDHVLRLPFPFLERRTLGDLLQGIASTETLARLATGSVVVPVLEAVFALPYLLLVGSTMPWLAVGLALLALLLAGVTLYGAQRSAALQSRALDAASRQRASLFETLSGMLPLKAAAAEATASARWLGILVDEQAVAVQRLRLGLTLDLTFEASSQLVFVAALIGGGALSFQGQLSVGALIANVLLAQSFMGSLLALNHAVLPLWACRSDARRVGELLAVAAEPRRSGVEHAPLRQLAASPPAISLQDVWFRYSPSSPWVLEGVSLQVGAGQMQRLSGPSGTGKTTVLRLIAGLYAAERGRITIGGAAPLRARGAVAYLPQQAHLFGGSLWENLRALSGSSDARILEAAALTGLDAIVAALPMGLDTLLPPGGATLSGGQRQLVVLTACVACERPVVLLDEALASLDRLTRERLLRSQLFAGRTVVWVEHDAAQEVGGEPQ